MVQCAIRGMDKELIISVSLGVSIILVFLHEMYELFVEIVQKLEDYSSTLYFLKNKVFPRPLRRNNTGGKKPNNRLARQF